MRKVLLVMKNNLYRFSKEKSMMIMVLLVMPIIVCLGVYFNGTDNIKGKIAIVDASTENKNIIESSMKGNEKIKLEFLKESPSKTELVKGVYLAEINFEKTKPVVISYGKEDIKKALEANLKGEVYVPENNTDTVQGKVIGFLIMFLFMGATTMVMEFFLQDRENGTYTRILSGNISYFQYMAGQILYALVILSLPSTVWTIFILKVMNVNLSISYSLLIFLLLLVGMLSSSFGVFVANIFKDRTSATMGGSILVMISCLLGGCLINFNDTNKVIGFIRNILPQKRLIDLANNFNNQDLIFVVFAILVFLVISIICGNKRYKNI